MDDEFQINDDFNWREYASDEQVLLDNGLIASEKEIFFAVEKLTPFLLEKEDRYPNESDIEMFILLLRGPS